MHNVKEAGGSMQARNAEVNMVAIGASRIICKTGYIMNSQDFAKGRHS